VGWLAAGHADQLAQQPGGLLEKDRDGLDVLPA
jgi:hypothetical protein